MNILKLICRTVLQLDKQACQLSQFFVNAVEQRQQQAVRNKLETEQLDRTRHPSKYLGTDQNLDTNERLQNLLSKLTVMNTQVYVDNLAAVTSERDLINLFSPYGNVVNVNIAVDRANHKPRGFGFVTMATLEGARAAIRALHGKQIGAHNLIVSEAWPHEQRAGAPGGARASAAVPAILANPPLKDAS